MRDGFDVPQKSIGEPELGGFLFDFSLSGTGVWVHGLVSLLLITAASTCILLGNRSWIWNLSASACVMVGRGAAIVSRQQINADQIHSNINLVFLFSVGPLLLHA